MKHTLVVPPVFVQQISGARYVRIFPSCYEVEMLNGEKFRNFHLTSKQKDLDFIDLVQAILNR